MAVNKLCSVFRRISINRPNSIIARYCSSYLEKERNNPTKFSDNGFSTLYPQTRIKFVPRTLSIDFGIPSGNIKSIIESPFNNIPSMEEPLNKRPVQNDLPLTEKSLELPTSGTTVEKLAIRLIVIRRRKMKKHKRKKLRKRMQFVWAKIRHNRNIAKEKKLQGELIGKIKEAQMFDAKEYVSKKLAIIDMERLPKTYRGEILPPRMIKQFMEEHARRKDAKRNKPRLKLD